MTRSSADRPAAPRPARDAAALGILSALSFCHLLNDMMQSLLPAIYPILKTTFALDFGQVGLITLTNQLTASLLQPIIGTYTDRRPLAYSLAIGMSFTLMGLVMLAGANRFALVLSAAALVGLGSSIFHPESSRIARLASGGRHGFAQALFQVGGNTGSSIGPLLAAFIVLPHGQRSIAWFSVAAVTAIVLLVRVGGWYKSHGRRIARRDAARGGDVGLSPKRVGMAIGILLLLTFSKYIYLASLSSYFTFYLIARFNLSVQSAQLHLFLFLAAVAAGTMIGGPVGDRIGRRYVILWSILGVLPFSLALPFANLFWTRILSVVIGLVLASAFSAILVYGQELLPGRVGMVAGLFFGVAFGVGGLGAALLGELMDHSGIMFVYRLCSLLPAIGVLAIWLPRLQAAEIVHS
jgi:FSR family fosmidomycin resistance protein-like MFS transporter